MQQQQQRQIQYQRPRRRRRLFPLQQRVWSAAMCNALQLLLVLPLISGIFPLTTAKSTIAMASIQSAGRGITALHPDWEHVNRTCLSRVCNDALNVQHLQQLRRHIRSDVDPCTNFYKYACGNWAAERFAEAPTTTMTAADEKLNVRYVQLFERALQKSTWLRSPYGYRLQKLRAQAEAQVMEDVVAGQQLHTQDESIAYLPSHDDNDAVFSQLLQYYRVCIGSAPMTLRGYHEQLRAEGLLRVPQRHWQETVAQFARYGYTEQFVQMAVKQQNATHYAIIVLPHDVNRRLNLTAELYEQLRDYTQKSQEELAVEFAELETNLESIVNSMCLDAPASSDCDLLQTYTYAELAAQCSEIDWQLLLGVPLGRRLQPDDLIRVDALETVRKLALYLNQVERSATNFLYTLARFLSYLEQQPYSPMRFGVSTSQCIRHLRKTLPLAMAYVYERAYYAPVRAESDRVIRSIFAQLKAEFARTLSLNRMQFDADIVLYLQQKLLSLRLNLGNLPLNATPAFYVDHMRQLNVSHTNFYRNHLHALSHTYSHQRRLATPASGDQRHSAWYTFNFHEPTFPDSLDSTPYYFCLSNIIIIPHAYLQTPFYDRRFWPVLLYGDLANTLGHELLHSFDSTFLEYDHGGNMNERMLQRIEANMHYARNVACLSEGTAYLGERIADVSGTRLALNTFLRDAQFLRTNGRLFFLQFAQFFCGAAQGDLQKPPDAWHDIDELRLNYTLAQMPEFSMAYNCPLNSPMNPMQRCEMW